MYNRIKQTLTIWPDLNISEFLVPKSQVIQTRLDVNNIWIFRILNNPQLFVLQRTSSSTAGYRNIEGLMQASACSKTDLTPQSIPAW